MRAPRAALAWESHFPLARHYAGEPPGPTCREPAGRWGRFSHRERHVQCTWFDAALRPGQLVTQDGESVEVEDPGVWNLEAGPDFLGAAIRLGPERRRLAGDVEVHIHPAAWRGHGHHADPRYRNVRLHVTYFPGPFPAADFPPGAVQIALRDPLARSPGFSFDQVDLTAYPFARRAPVPPCLAVLRTWPGPYKQALLDAAGQERLRSKAARLAERIAEQGLDQAVYEETLAALGFKLNKRPFRELARVVPVDRLRAAAEGDLITAFALLCGTAGLLPDTPGTRWAEADIRFFRRVWDAWWKHRERWAHLALPRSGWMLGGQRPANHPLRRLMAAAALFASPGGGAERWLELARRYPGDFPARFARELASLRAPYFDQRAVFGGLCAARPMALIGPDRAQSLLLNVAIPLLAVAGPGEPFARGLLDALPAEADNTVVRQTALNLFGPDHPTTHYRTGLRRQGLIQIFHDYCLNDRSRCESCTFPGVLRKYAETAGLPG